jgi:spore maturation protein CgeB
MWDHFPTIANYTSNRVPISLASGVPHVTNYKPGYELIYPPGSGLYWGKTVRSVAEMVAVVLAMPRKDLMTLGECAASFARDHRSEETLMERLVEDVSAFRSASALDER